jgi:hypothetical protein
MDGVSRYARPTSLAFPQADPPNRLASKLMLPLVLAASGAATRRAPASPMLNEFILNARIRGPGRR